MYRLIEDEVAKKLVGDDDIFKNLRANSRGKMHTLPNQTVVWHFSDGVACSFAIGGTYQQIVAALNQSTENPK